MVGDRSKLKSKKRKKIRFLFILFLLIAAFPLLSSLKSFCKYKIFNNKEINRDLYNFMMDKNSRENVYSEAIKLNNGSSANTCVYFIAEALRQNGEDIDYSICNTSQLLNIMKNEGWKKETDYKKLKLGDICFTTDQHLNKNGIPTHTYIFMGWKNGGKYDYAYICDNQAKDYEGKIYHLRNITILESTKGNQKEPFSFFLYR